MKFYHFVHIVNFYFMIGIFIKNTKDILRFWVVVFFFFQRKFISLLVAYTIYNPRKGSIYNPRRAAFRERIALFPLNFYSYGIIFP